VTTARILDDSFLILLSLMTEERVDTIEDLEGDGDMDGIDLAGFVKWFK